MTLLRVTSTELDLLVNLAETLSLFNSDVVFLHRTSGRRLDAIDDARVRRPLPQIDAAVNVEPSLRIQRPQGG